MTWRRYDSSRFAKQWTLEAGILRYKHFAITLESAQTTYVYMRIQSRPLSKIIDTLEFENYIYLPAENVSHVCLYIVVLEFSYTMRCFLCWNYYDSFVQNTQTNVFVCNSECAFDSKPMQTFRIMWKWYENT